MKIAVLSDIHGHWPALQATAAHINQWRPDYVIVNGDIVNRGPKSHACWQFIQQRQQQDGWLVTRGNHEDYVIQYLDHIEDPQSSPDFNPISWWSFQQLGRETVQDLAQLPLETSLYHPQGGELRAIHASQLGTRYGVWHFAPVTEVRQQIAPAPAVFCTAHIHFPYLRILDQTLIVNDGSAGSLSDFGDTRATYAQITWHGGRWHAHIARLPYDREQAKRDYEETNMLAETSPHMRIIYLEWLTGWPIMQIWRDFPQRDAWVQSMGPHAAVQRFARTLTISEEIRQASHAFYRLENPSQRPMSITYPFPNGTSLTY